MRFAWRISCAVLRGGGKLIYCVLRRCMKMSVGIKLDSELVMVVGRIGARI